jgi:AcrR family transcriptional regulator
MVRTTKSDTVQKGLARLKPLLNQRSFESISIRELCNIFECSTGTFYSIFPNGKLELFRLIILDTPLFRPATALTTLRLSLTGEQIATFIVNELISYWNTHRWVLEGMAWYQNHYKNHHHTHKIESESIRIIRLEEDTEEFGLLLSLFLADQKKKPIQKTTERFKQWIMLTERMIEHWILLGQPNPSGMTISESCMQLYQLLF